MRERAARRVSEETDQPLRDRMPSRRLCLCVRELFVSVSLAALAVLTCGCARTALAAASAVVPPVGARGTVADTILKRYIILPFC